MILQSSSKNSPPLFFLLLALGLAFGPLVYLSRSEPLLIKQVIGIIVILLAALVWLLVTARHSLSVRVDLDLGLWLGILGLSVAATLAAADQTIAIHGVYAHYQGILSLGALSISFLLWKQADWQSKILQVFLVLLVVGAVAQALLALAQMGAAAFGSQLMGVGVRSIRTSGTFGNPNVFGSYMVPMTLLSIALAQIVSARHKKLIYASTVLILLASLSTLSLSVWLAFGVTGVILVIDRWRRGGVNRRFLLTLLAAVLLIVAFFLFTESGLTRHGIVERINRAATVSGGGAGSRVQLWKAGARLIVARPIVGWGPDNFRVAAPGAGLLGGVIELPAHPHNLLMEFAVNFGLPAALLLALLIMRAIYRFWNRPQAGASHDWGADANLWLGAAIISQLVIILTQSLNFIPFMLLLALLSAQAGVASAVSGRSFMVPASVRSMLAVAVALLLAGSAAGGWRRLTAESAYRRSLSVSELQAPSVTWAERAVLYNPNIAVYRYRLARIYLARLEAHGNEKDYRQGLKVVVAGRNSRPLDPTPWLIEARLHQARGATGSVEAAQSAAERALRLHPRSAPARRVLGDLSLRTRDYQAAADHYTHAVNSDPTSYYVWLHLGQARYKGRDRPGALAAYTQARRLRPSSRTAALMISLIKARNAQESGIKAELQRAIKIAEGILKEQPHNLTAALIVADSYFELKDYTQAVASYAAAVGIRPRSFYVRYQEGKALQRVGRQKEALEAYREAVKIKPDSSGALIEIEKIEDELGINDE